MNYMLVGIAAASIFTITIWTMIFKKATKPSNEALARQLLKDLLAKQEQPAPEEAAEQKRPKTERPKTKGVRAEDTKKNILYVPADEYQGYAKMPSILNLPKRKLRKALKNPPSRFLVRMQMLNEKWIEFVVMEDEKHRGSFLFNKGTYIIDEEAAYDIVNTGFRGLDYHETLPFPVKQSKRPIPELEALQKRVLDEYAKPTPKGIPAKDIRDTLENSQITKIKNIAHPVALHRFVMQEIILAILKSSAISKILKILVIIVIIALLLTMLDTGVDIWHSGVLDSVTSQFK